MRKAKSDRDFLIQLAGFIDGIQHPHQDDSLFAGGGNFAFSLNGIDELLHFSGEFVAFSVVEEFGVGDPAGNLGTDDRPVRSDFGAALGAEQFDLGFVFGVACPGNFKRERSLLAEAYKARRIVIHIECSVDFRRSRPHVDVMVLIYRTAEF